MPRAKTQRAKVGDRGIGARRSHPRPGLESDEGRPFAVPGCNWQGVPMKRPGSLPAICSPDQARPGGAIHTAILKASGVTNWVTIKAIGQAVMKVSGQCGRNCGPALMKPMIPDMMKAIMKVMQSDRTNWVFLGKKSLQQDGSWRRHVPPQHHPACKGSGADGTQSDEFHSRLWRRDTNRPPLIGYEEIAGPDFRLKVLGRMAALRKFDFAKQRPC